MHFALPTRGNHRSSPFLTNSASRSYIPRGLHRPLCVFALFLVALFVLLRTLSGDGRPTDAPRTVMVLVLNRTDHSNEHIKRIVENRQEYAKAHGYGLYIKNAADYPGDGASTGWARIPAMRHAMATYKYSEYFWYLDQDAIIMNPALSLDDHVLGRLSSLMRRDVPIVPPSSVIKTYRHVPAERMQFIITQDREGLQPDSMIIKNGAWANYFLDAWYDPMFRLYNFPKKERHALEHIVQWHPTILTKLALIPQRVLGAYTPAAAAGGAYEDGDFVILFHECWKPGRSCEKEFNTYWDKRKPAEES